jgi:transaldolase
MPLLINQPVALDHSSLSLFNQALQSPPSQSNSALNSLYQAFEMAALKMYCSSAVVGNNLGTKATTPVASGEFVGLKMMPSLKASSFTTRSLPVYSAPLTHLAKVWNTLSTERKTLLHDMYEQQKQSPWYDNLRRPVTMLEPLIKSGVRGVTSNPTIFEKAITGSAEYDDQFRYCIREGKNVEEAYWELVIKDIQDACDLFLPLYKESNGGDGFISVEVSPLLANETQATIDSAKYLHQRVNRENVLIKIPATKECLESIKQVIASSISVNVTLIFSLARYEAVMDAYIAGLEAVEGDLSKIASVASFFVSRVDSLVDKKLNAIGTEEALSLKGKAANAQAALAFKAYQEKFSGPRWEALEKRGAKKQRVLWASTGVKDPSYPDTLYVNPLIGPDTVTTMPDGALNAFVDHGTVARTIDADLAGAQRIYDAVEKLGIHWEDVGNQLEHEGVASFKKSFTDLVQNLTGKAEALAKTI